MNFRQDFRYYTVREYAVMGLSAAAAGLLIAVMLSAVSGGAAGDSLKRASVREPLPATNFAVVQHERDARVAAQQRRDQILATRHERAVRERSRARARAARARLVAARSAPRSRPDRTVAERTPAVAPVPTASPAPRPVARPAPQRSTGTAEKHGGGAIQFDDSG